VSLRSSILVPGRVALVLALSGCASTSEDSADDGQTAVTNIPASPVEQQDTNNCWVYTGLSWAESLHAQATGEILDLSEAWTTYWRWFELVANASLRDQLWNPDTVLEQGQFSMAGKLMARYGVVEESGFVTVATSEALRRFNASLASGKLETRGARRDPVKVRRALDEAFGLSRATVGAMDALFGPDGSRTPNAATSVASAATLKLTLASQFTVQLPNPSTHRPERRTLADAVGQGAPGYGWEGAIAPYFGDEREWLRRIQRALHDGYPVPLIWYVDRGASADGGSEFELPANGITDGGWHVSLLTDYAATNVPGFGELRAGRTERRPEALEAALADQVVVTTLRVKNSWGPLGFTFDFTKRPGYTDLQRSYFTAGVPWLPLRIARNVNLPAGY
jgi:hypothetical protein